MIFIKMFLLFGIRIVGLIILYQKEKLLAVIKSQKTGEVEY